jgi:hypothetical protein
MKQIMKKRTTFETTLVRRVAKKADFLRYITYEAELERLRRKRSAELGLFMHHTLAPSRQALTICFNRFTASSAHGFRLLARSAAIPYL